MTAHLLLSLLVLALGAMIAWRGRRRPVLVVVGAAMVVVAVTAVVGIGIMN